jgi:electron transfer flavoprotein alpha/beta subunit
MNIPVANFASKVKILENKEVEVEREIDGGLQTV